MCESLLIVLTALPLDRVPGTPASGWGGGAWASGELLRGRAEKQPWAFGEDPAGNWQSRHAGEKLNLCAIITERAFSSY